MTSALDSHVHRVTPGDSDLVLITLHGTGGHEDSLTPLARLIDPNCTVVGIRGNVQEGGMPRFFRRFAEGVFDLEDVARRADALADFLVVLREQPFMKGRRAAVVGYSNGANVAAAILLRRPGVISCAILLRAMVTIEPVISGNGSGSRVLIASGERDPIAPVANAARLAEGLRAGGAAVTHAVLATDHGLGRGDVDAAQAFLAQAELKRL
jgi:phospholipase/carboxylesterase